MANDNSLITERQVAFLSDLVRKKDLDNTRLTAEQRQWLLAGDYSGMSKAQASKAIKLLLELNDKPIEPSTTGDEPAYVYKSGEPVATPVQPLEKGARENLISQLKELEDKVEAGYYFVVNPSLPGSDVNNGERFYHVTKPESPSRWAGYTFIESRGGDYLYKVKDMKQRIAVLEAILVDPLKAMNEYGIRLGVCGSCGRTLTARDSRLRGLGPICAARILGAPTDEQLALIDHLGLRGK